MHFGSRHVYFKNLMGKAIQAQVKFILQLKHISFDNKRKQRLSHVALIMMFVMMTASIYLAGL